MTQADNSIQQLLEQLKQEFLSELPGRLSAIENLLIQNEQPDNYQELFRLIHNLKGSAGTHGFQIISTVCHNFESHISNLFDNETLHTQPGTQSSLVFIDLLRKAVDQIERGKTEFSAIQTELERISQAQATHQQDVIVVESSKLHSELIKQALAELPVRISFFDNGLHALESLLIKKYSALITGFETQMLNGEALIAAIRLARGKNRDITSILLTSKAYQPESTRSRPDYIIKRDKDLQAHLLEVVSLTLNKLHS